MNKKLISLFSATAICAALLFSSCGQDDPEPTPDRAKFTGNTGTETWTCAENSTQNGSSTFTIHVKNSSANADDILIENFYGAGFQSTATATVSGNNFSTSNQPYGGFTITSLSGSSTGANSFTMNYIIQNGSVYDTCSANCTK